MQRSSLFREMQQAEDHHATEEKNHERLNPTLQNRRYGSHYICKRTFNLAPLILSLSY